MFLWRNKPTYLPILEIENKFWKNDIVPQQKVKDSKLEHNLMYTLV